MVTKRVAAPWGETVTVSLSVSKKSAALQKLDRAALYLVSRGHIWTAAERKAYEQAVRRLK